MHRIHRTSACPLHLGYSSTDLGLGQSLLKDCDVPTGLSSPQRRRHLSKKEDPATQVQRLLGSEAYHSLTASACISASARISCLTCSETPSSHSRHSPRHRSSYRACASATVFSNSACELFFRSTGKLPSFSDNHNPSKSTGQSVAASSGRRVPLCVKGY